MKLNKMKTKLKQNYNKKLKQNESKNKTNKIKQ